MERSLVVIKPDGVKRNLIGEIIKRFESTGLKVVGLKMLRAEDELLKKHYPEDEDFLISLGKKSKKAGDEISDVKAQGLKIVTWLRNYLKTGPVVAIVFEGENAIQRVREVTGYTDPSKAEKGTIRGDLGNDSILQANKEQRSVRNLIHASGNKEEAKKEIALWFTNDELFNR